MKIVATWLCVLSLSALLYSGNNNEHKRRLDYCVAVKMQGQPQPRAEVQRCDKVILDHTRATKGPAAADYLQKLKESNKK